MTLVWRSLYGGDVRHAARRVPDVASSYMRSVCGIGPYHLGDWFGAGEEDAVKVMGLAVCQRCTAYLEVDGTTVRVDEVPLTPAQLVAAVRGRYSGQHR